MYNKVILIGNLTKDPEVKYTPGGTAVANFTLAVNSKFKAQGEQKEDVLFMRCVVFGKAAESCGQYLSKGSKALTEGRLRERKWESDGQEHRVMELLVDNVRFLTQKRDGESSGGGGADLEPF